VSALPGPGGFPLEWWHLDADKYADALAPFLQRNVGLPFCAACLAHEVGLGVQQVRAGAWRLWEGRGYARRLRWCARCVRFDDTIEAPYPGQAGGCRGSC
jgi:hypothetical protein